MRMFDWLSGLIERFLDNKMVMCDAYLLSGLSKIEYRIMQVGYSLEPRYIVLERVKSLQTGKASNWEKKAGMNGEFISVLEALVELPPKASVTKWYGEKVKGVKYVEDLE